MRLLVATAVVLLAAPSQHALASAALSAGLTETVAKLQGELDARGRSAVSADLDAALRGHTTQSVAPSTSVQIARLMLSVRGATAASSWANSAREHYHSVIRESAASNRAVSAQTWRDYAVSEVIAGHRQNARLRLQACRASHTASSCDPTVAARTLSQLAWHQDAIALMREALDAEKEPSDRLYINAAQVAESAGAYKLQLQLIDDALRRTPRHPALLDAATAALRRLGRYEEAMQRLRSAHTEDAKTRGILARYHHAFRDLEGATTRRQGPTARYNKVLQDIRARAAAKADAPARFVAAMLALQDARYDATLEEMRALRPLAPNDARPWAVAALIEIWRGNRNKAQRLLTAAHKADPADNIVPYARSLLARATKDWATAAKHLEEFLSMRRARGTTRFRLKKIRVLGDLHALRRGEDPGTTDRPDHPSRRYHLYSLFEPFELPSIPVSLGAVFSLLFFASLGAWWSSGRG